MFAAKCELCHGKAGTGGLSAALAGRERNVANYVPYATTIFDFTRRAMPWTQPKSLTNDELTLSPPTSLLSTRSSATTTL